MPGANDLGFPSASSSPQLHQAQKDLNNIKPTDEFAISFHIVLLNKCCRASLLDSACKCGRNKV